MTERAKLSDDERKAALADIVGEDQTAVVSAAKKLSDDHTTTSDLLASLSRETRAANRQAMLYSLAWHASLDTWDLMLGIVSDVREAPGVRGQAAEAIAYMFRRATEKSPEKVPRGIETLTRALDDASPEVRYCAVYALGASAKPEVVPTLERMLQDKTPVAGWVGTVADQAAEALEKFEFRRLYGGG